MTTVYGFHTAGEKSKIILPQKLCAGKPCFFDCSSQPAAYSHPEAYARFQSSLSQWVARLTPAYTSHCTTELLPPCLCPTRIPQTQWKYFWPYRRKSLHSPW